jgi:hypothetical protein
MSIPIGFPFGRISVSGPSGRAVLNFPVTGSKATGQIFVEATKNEGIWTLKRLSLKVDGRDGVIDLNV